MGTTPTLITGAWVPLIVVSLLAAIGSCRCLAKALRRNDEPSPVELQAAVA